MGNVLIVIETVEAPLQLNHVCTSQVELVAALKRAILAQSQSSPIGSLERQEQTVLPEEQVVSASKFCISESEIQVISSGDLAEGWGADNPGLAGGLICPLTLEVPEWLTFPGQAIYQSCRDLISLRRHVKAWGYESGIGDLWLPIALTAKGPLYGEVIGLRGDSLTQPANASSRYTQPIHLPDRWRQPLYELGFRLIRSLKAPPAVYLVQVGIQTGKVYFDRLIPFPAEPAIASLNRQIPDLFVCHWCCLTGKPIYDLKIRLML